MGTDKEHEVAVRGSREQHARSEPRPPAGDEKEEQPGDPSLRGPGGGSTKPSRTRKNNLRQLRLDRMMSKAELARRAGVSTLTIDRIERGLSCRMDTKRKILEALGLTPQDRVAVFGEDE